MKRVNIIKSLGITVFVLLVLFYGFTKANHGVLHLSKAFDGDIFQLVTCKSQGPCIPCDGDDVSLFIFINSYLNLV